MAEGPPEAGVVHINDHGREKYEGCLECSWTETKGRILRATRAFAQGEVILVESPLHIVQEDKKSAAFERLRKLCKQQRDDFEYEPLWYWCALQSLTAVQLKGAKETGLTGTSPETMRNLLLLHHEVTDPSSATDVLVKKLVPEADPVILERLIQIWVLNCFEYSDSPQGYSTYFFSSFMSHSCFPNAVWHYTGADHVLRARRDIKVGDEVCISYLPEDGLLSIVPSRRWELHETKRFWCDCARCAGQVDHSRGLLCPHCGCGRIFARVPERGPAPSNLPLASQLAGEACDKCAQRLAKNDAEALAAKEVEWKATADRLAQTGGTASLTMKEAKELEEGVDAVFVQHVYADLVWEQLAAFYAAHRRRADQRRVLERRRVFHAEAYPGLSGAHAWTLEGYGDAIVELANENSAKGQGAAEDWGAATAMYSEAIGILSQMFGNKHEYVVQVDEKLARLSKKAKA